MCGRWKNLDLLVGVVEVDMFEDDECKWFKSVCNWFMLEDICGWLELMIKGRVDFCNRKGKMNWKLMVIRVSVSEIRKKEDVIECFDECEEKDWLCFDCFFDIIIKFYI